MGRGWRSIAGSGLLTLDGPSVQMAPEGSLRIVGMIIGMIKVHPTECRMPRQAMSRDLARRGRRRRPIGRALEAGSSAARQSAACCSWRIDRVASNSRLAHHSHDHDGLLGSDGPPEAIAGLVISPPQPPSPRVGAFATAWPPPLRVAPGSRRTWKPVDRACGCQIFGHIMRPACIHGSAHPADLVARSSQPVPGQLVRLAQVAVPAPRPGAGGGRCSGRRTRPGQLAAVGSPKISILSSTSRRTVPTHRSAWAFARGARTGVRSTLSPSATKTASNAAVNLVSRSRSRNRKRPTRSFRPISRLRACCVTQSPTGCGVTPST
jgi:hypothetical protein